MERDLKGTMNMVGDYLTMERNRDNPNFTGSNTGE